MKNVREQILMVVKSYGVDDEKINEGKISLIDDFEFDSLQLVEFLTKIEEKFGLTFTDGEKLLDMVDDLESLIEYVENKVSF